MLFTNFILLRFSSCVAAIGFVSVYFSSWSFYRSQRSWGKVIFSEACVKNSVHRVRGRAWQGACVAGGMRGRGGCVAGGGVRCAWQILRDTVNERAVRILLECILFSSMFFPFSVTLSVPFYFVSLFLFLTILSSLHICPVYDYSVSVCPSLC